MRRSLKPRWKDEPDPDCGTCLNRKECENAEEGSFCTRWRGKESERTGTDPNQLWRTGEDAGLDR